MKLRTLSVLALIPAVVAAQASPTPEKSLKRKERYCLGNEHPLVTTNCELACYGEDLNFEYPALNIPDKTFDCAFLNKSSDPAKNTARKALYCTDDQQIVNCGDSCGICSGVVTTGPTQAPTKSPTAAPTAAPTPTQLVPAPSRPPSPMPSPFPTLRNHIFHTKMSDDDYYYYRNKGFEDYIPTAKDPGPWMLIAVSIYSICCLIAVPVVVQLFTKCRRRQDIPCDSDGEVVEEESSHLSSRESSSDMVDVDINRDDTVLLREWVREEETSKIDSLRDFLERSKRALNIDMDGQHLTSPSPVSSYLEELERKRNKIKRIRNNAYRDEEQGDQKDNGLSDDEMDHHGPGPNTAKTYDHNELDCGEKIGNSINQFIHIINFDSESKRILHLGIPFTISSISDAVFDAVTIALISNYLGVQSLSAYIVVNMLIELSTLISGGLVESVDTICAHAIGAENYKLAGQYVQISTVLYIGLSIPIFILWYFVMGDCIRLFGFGDDVVAIGEQYTKIVVFDYVMDGIYDAYSELLNLTGYATPAVIFDVASGAIDIAVIWSILAFTPGMSLFWVGVTHLIGTVVCFIIFTSICICLGWLDPFLEGMVHTFAFRNTAAVKHVIKTSIPLALGSFLEYGEYEVLIFFVAALGPAEVAAWGIIESLWDIFEATTRGLMEAGAMRLAFHLGKGDTKKSPTSAWKTLFLSTLLRTVTTGVLFLCSENLSTWFTKDETLQDMVNSVIPIIGIGNILMVFGMVSWELVCAQGRFKLATTVSAAMSFCVTLPLSALFCFYFRFDLKGIVSAIVIGYSTTGLAFAVILLLSDWKKISDIIIQQNAEESDTDDDDIIEVKDEDSSSDDDSSENPVVSSYTRKFEREIGHGTKKL
ncbi:hypothetical protein CTEN210_02506 [Chaetoceros tenuissimus]|uniref:Multidrug and toxin extrusion protein n=1 Tax=Chaetoceros tenuissimus TaxID=426638 RepID=A0AAD3CH66_9STRA|nr:hypothetical protein CTEN210_02506 [Chaetoceros tenuissimus]